MLLAWVTYCPTIDKREIFKLLVRVVCTYLWSYINYSIRINRCQANFQRCFQIYELFSHCNQNIALLDHTVNCVHQMCVWRVITYCQLRMLC